MARRSVECLTMPKEVIRSGVNGECLGFVLANDKADVTENGGEATAGLSFIRKIDSKVL